MPSNKRCVVPPIRNPWPLIEDKLSFSQISLQRRRNQVRLIGDHESAPVSKANSGACDGTAEFEARWRSRAGWAALTGGVCNIDNFSCFLCLSMRQMKIHEFESICSRAMINRC